MPAEGDRGNFVGPQDDLVKEEHYQSQAIGKKERHHYYQSQNFALTRVLHRTSFLLLTTLKGRFLLEGILALYYQSV